MSEEMVQRLMSEPTIDLVSAGQLLGIARSATYRARKSGDIPTIKVGGQFRVPTAKLRVMLGLPEQPAATPSATSRQAA